jgi:hypothetical protein
MEKTKEAKKKFSPPKEVRVVKPIMRARNPLIQDPEHEAFFLVGNATITYCLPVDRQGNLLNPFESKEEQEWLEESLDMDLNHHKAKENAWHRIKVKLGKDTKKLNLSNPKHYLEYIVLRANKLYIAPDGESMNKLATYRYALVSEEFETKKQVKKADLEIEAYMFLGKLKEDKQEMIDFLKVYGKRVSNVSKSDFLISELKKAIDTDLDGFLKVARDKENYEIKLLIANAVECGALNKQGRKYHLPGGDDLCGPGDVPTLANAVAWLQNPANQDILTMLKARVETAKD